MKILKVIFSCLIFSLILLAGCNNVEKSEDPSDNNNDDKSKITDKKFNNLPYCDYYSKSDLTYDEEQNNWYLYNDETINKAEENASINGSTHKFLKNGSKEPYYFGEENGTIQSVNYNVMEGEKFETPAIKLKLNKSQIYNFDMIRKNQLKNNLPLNIKEYADNRVEVKSENDNSEEPFTIDNSKGGIIKLDISVKNKSPHEVFVNDFINVAIKKQFEAKPIAGRITINNKSYGENDNILNHLSQKIKSGQEMNATMYYAANEDLKNEKSLVFHFNYGKPLSDHKYYGQVSF